MIIHAHILAFNEEKILPFTLDYYSKFCEKIFIYDNMSTDGSDEIYKKYTNVIVIKWSSNNEINELNYTNIKSNGYRQESRDADWVIVCDCDEILYHPRLLDKLKMYKENGVTVPRINGHDMVSETFPEYDGGLITDKIKTGSEVYPPFCKNIVFNPKLDVQFGIGGHSFQANNPVYSNGVDLKLLHYKFLGVEYVERIYQARAERLSEFNKQNKFGEHYFNVPYEYMTKLLEENIQVI
jgi:glycosyltransferase involved in cell wall biosynthesis